MDLYEYYIQANLIFDGKLFKAGLEWSFMKRDIKCAV